jgi:hypothetical protein
MRNRQNPEADGAYRTRPGLAPANGPFAPGPGCNPSVSTRHSPGRRSEFGAMPRSTRERAVTAKDTGIGAGAKFMAKCLHRLAESDK